MFKLFSLLISLLFFVSSTEIDWSDFDKTLKIYLSDLPSHLRIVQCKKLNLEYETEEQKTKIIVDQFELRNFKFSIFSDLIHPYEKKPNFFALRLRFDSFYFKMTIKHYPEIRLKFINFWLKVLFSFDKDPKKTIIERVKTNFDRIEWDDEDPNSDLKGEVDSTTSNKLKSSIKQLEKNLQDILKVIVTSNNNEIYKFLIEKEYKSVDIEQLLTRIFANYDKSKKTINVDSKWLKDSFKSKKDLEAEVKRTLNTKPFDDFAGVEELKDDKTKNSKRKSNSKTDL